PCVAPSNPGGSPPRHDARPVAPHNGITPADESVKAPYALPRGTRVPPVGPPREQTSTRIPWTCSGWLAAVVGAWRPGARRAPFAHRSGTAAYEVPRTGAPGRRAVTTAPGAHL